MYFVFNEYASDPNPGDSIVSGDGNLTIDGCFLGYSGLYSGSAQKSYTPAPIVNITGDVTINGEMTAEATNGTTEIIGAYLDASMTAEETGAAGIGVRATGKVTVNGGAIIGGICNSKKYPGGAAIVAGTVEINGGPNENSAYSKFDPCVRGGAGGTTGGNAVIAKSDVTLKGGLVWGGNGAAGGHAIVSEDTVTVTGGKVFGGDATATTSDGVGGNIIIAKGNVTIHGESTAACYLQVGNGTYEVGNAITLLPVEDEHSRTLTIDTATVYGRANKTANNRFIVMEANDKAIITKSKTGFNATIPLFTNGWYKITEPAGVYGNFSTGKSIVIDEAQKAAADVDPKQYTQNSLAVLDQALAAIPNNFSTYTQTTGANAINKLAKGINDAIDSLVAFTATMDVKSAAELDEVLASDAVTAINVTGSFEYDKSIRRDVNINVESGSTLTLNYMTDNSKVSTVCNANITVEDGGAICFNQKYTMNTSYLVMNGDFKLDSGAAATTTSAAFDGNILFQGAFTNNGSFDVEKGNAFLKYGTTPGTFTKGQAAGTPCYNLCITPPKTTSLSDPTLYITGVVGTVAIGEKLHAIIDGMGELKEPNILGISWGDSNNGGNTFEYTVPASKAGSTITVKVNGSPSNSSYAYFLVDGTTVKEVTDTDSTGFTTAKVDQLKTVYVGGTGASDSNTGKSADKSLATLSNALAAVADNGKVVLCGDVGTTADGWLAANGSVTITNTDGVNTYSNATLTLNGAQYASGNITFENIQFAVGTVKNSGILVPTAANTSLCFSNVTATGSDGKLLPLSVQKAFPSTGVAVTVRDCSIQMDTYEADSLTLNHATVISNLEPADLLGNVSLTNGSTLLTPQIINNLTSDNSDNALALFSSEGTPVPVTVNGAVTIVEGKPITLLNYTGNAYEAFTAGNLTLLTSSAPNDSLTAEKFITKDTVNYGLRKDGNSIVTEKKIVVTFNANGGTCETATMIAGADGKLATLPTPTRSGSYSFDGWYTAETGGTKVTAENVFTDSTTVYAHWNYTGGSSDGGSSDTTETVTNPDGSTTTTTTDKTTGTITETTKKPDGSSVETVTKTDGSITTTDKAANGVNTVTKTDKDGNTTANVTVPSTVKDDVTVNIPADLGKLNGTVSAEITYPDGKKETVTGKYENGKVTITVSGNASVKLLGDFAPLTDMPFTDVAKEAYYFYPVLWAIQNDITSGTSASTFSPEDTCTRAQAVTFLWRSMGSPEPKNTNCPFTDVNAGEYYYKAVLWAVEKGITDGTTATTFSPEDTVSRAQVATFLWRAAGKPATSAANPFTDVSGDDYFADAVLWAVERKITEGTTATTFSPANGCSRAQNVTFLYRNTGK